MKLKALLLAALVILTSTKLGSASASTEIPNRKIKAIAFDGFPIFDPRPLAAAVENAFPGNGQEFMKIWRGRLFEYQWLRALGGKYENFMQIAESSLQYTSAQLSLDLTPGKKKTLLGEFLNLKTWPDAPESLRELRRMGYKLGFLTNMTPEMIRNGLEKAELTQEIDFLLSTDSIRTYKPSPNAYRLAEETLRLPKSEILFVAFAGWDAAGAKWYGLPTFWVNRTGAPAEGLGEAPDGSSMELKGLIEFLNNRK